MSASAFGTRVLWVAGIATVIAIIAGVMVMGSPGQQRQARLDQTRLSDLQSLQESVRTYWKEHAQLPVALDVVAAQPGVRLPLRDPGSQAPYRYRVIDADHFELCAVFATDSADDAPRRRFADSTWAHPRGEHCFRRVTKEPD